MFRAKSAQTPLLDHPILAMPVSLIRPSGFAIPQMFSSMASVKNAFQFSVCDGRVFACWHKSLVAILSHSSRIFQRAGV